MRVGTSHDFLMSIPTGEDHPHACGDKKTTLTVTQAVPGSSPCVWGQVIGYTFRNGDIGIIPMRVGTRAVKPAQQAN